MSRIGIHINGFEQLLLNQLARHNQAALASSFRLFTGKKVNSPNDNPSAFLQIDLVETRLRQVQQLQSNIEAAASIGAETQIAVDEIRTQLEAIRDSLLLDEEGGLTSNERNTQQLVIDDAITSIRTIAGTSIQGKRILDGSSNYTFSGLNTAQIERIDVHSLANDTTVSGTVTTAATQASVTYFGPGGRISSNATFTLTGARGSTSISVVNNELLTAARDRINADSHDTGITASVAGNNLIFTSVDYGANATLNIAVASGTFSTVGTTAGSDAVVTINGRAISNTYVDGNRVTYSDNGVHLTVNLRAGFTGSLSTVSVLNDTAASFALTESSRRTDLGLPGLFPELLGGVSGNIAQLGSGGSLSGLSTNTWAALRVVDEALDRLSLVEAKIDAFTDISVESASRLIDELATDLESSLETLNAVDEEREELLLAKYDSLSQNAIAAIAVLNQQRSYVLGIVNQLAGL